MSYCKCTDPSFCDLFKNPCKISALDLEEDAERRVNCPAYFNGFTKLGYQTPIREAVNPGCRDPISGKPQVGDFLPKPDIDSTKASERYHPIDVYAGVVNGINYGRFHRLIGHKLKHARSPYGPNQKFCVPITSQMNYGWFLRDIECLDKTKWYKTDEFFPQRRSEMTKYVFSPTLS